MNNSDRLKQFWADVRAGLRQPPQRKQSDGTITRRVRCDHNWLKGNEVVITIYPHGEIGFREPRSRAEYKLSMREAFRSAVVLTTNKLTARAKELRKAGHSLASARRMARREIL